MVIKYFRYVFLITSLFVLSSYSARARRLKSYTIPQQLIKYGESTIQADDGNIFILKLQKTLQDDRFPGERYTISVLVSGIEIAYSCFRVYNEWVYGYEDFRTNDAFYYFHHPDNASKSYEKWLSMSDGRNAKPALMVDKSYRLQYKGIGTTLTSIKLQLAQILGAKYVDAINVLNPGFHQVMGYQKVLRSGVRNSINMTFGLSASAILPPIGITRRP